VAATAIEMFRKLIDEARVGDSCGVLLSDVRQSDVHRGDVLASPGTVSCVSRCTLNIFLLSRADGGLSGPVADGSSLDLHLHGVDVAATISIQADDRRLHPGRESIVSVTLASPAPLARGMVVAVRRRKESVGLGSIVELSL
jgi:elongation factor Tu